MSHRSLDSQNMDWNWVYADGDIPCQKAKIRSSMQGWKPSWINLLFRTESYITAVDYNKINIKWKKSSDTTSYIVYYKEAGNSKWIKLKTLGSTRPSYTHTSSKKYPIIVGQKYQYTVKAYNRDTKKYGSYNTKRTDRNCIIKDGNRD